MKMKYITIDGDDVGQKITSSYLRNDLSSLSELNILVKRKTSLIAEFLKAQGFVIIFCAADGVAGYWEGDHLDDSYIYSTLQEIGGEDMSFSAGVGRSLRESYMALLSAKSSGKGRLHNFESAFKDV